jgi:hypothetical protein
MTSASKGRHVPDSLALRFVGGTADGALVHALRVVLNKAGTTRTTKLGSRIRRRTIGMLARKTDAALELPYSKLLKIGSAHKASLLRAKNRRAEPRDGLTLSNARKTRLGRGEKFLCSASETDFASTSATSARRSHSPTEKIFTA